MKIEALLKEFPEAVRKWGPGTVIIEQGQPCDCLHIVLEGEIEVWAQYAGHSSKVETLGEGECIGEVTMLDPGPATATVRTTGECSTLQLSHAELDELWNRQPRLASDVHSDILLALASRLRFATCTA